MNPINNVEEFLELHEWFKERRESLPSEKELYLEMIKVYYDSTRKSDKKRSAKMIKKHQEKMKEFGLWKFINVEELNNRLL